MQLIPFPVESQLHVPESGLDCTTAGLAHGRLLATMTTLAVGSLAQRLGAGV